MFQLGSKYIMPLVALSVMVSYFCMMITQTTLSDAQESGWFWNEHDFEDNDSHGSEVSAVGIDQWLVPLPFGVIHGLVTGNFDVKAIRNGLPTVCAMAFIYALRCSLHAPALKKTKQNILSIIEDAQKVNDPTKFEFRHQDSCDSTISGMNNEYKTHQVDVLKVLMWYGHSNILAGVLGGFTALPSIGAAPTLTKVRKRRMMFHKKVLNDC